MLNGKNRHDAMAQVYATRVKNVRAVLKHHYSGNKASMARALGVSKSMLTHIMGSDKSIAKGTNPKRNIGERQARDLEHQLGLLPGYLDQVHG